MTFIGLLLATLLVPVGWLLVTAEEAAGNGPGPTGNGPETTGTAGPRPVVTTNSSGLNSTRGGKMLGGLDVDSSMIQRALYVLIGVTAIGLLYFLIRAVRLKRPANKKKYGLLSNYEDSVEMEAVESEEDDTLYEARSLRR
ncbi:protein FAM174C [Anarhichas minor]|uniref:protein FAM174C n=1 Tax=Anarrhichthys ocellatus TaxID=433405 RepID=UPI0012ED2CD4|nr:protein FAM174C-like [Anarrhichthys ocellatus]